MAQTIDLGRVTGKDGVGVPDGGAAGQALVKQSNDNGDAVWKTLTAEDVNIPGYKVEMWTLWNGETSEGNTITLSESIHNFAFVSAIVDWTKTPIVAVEKGGTYIDFDGNNGTDSYVDIVKASINNFNSDGTSCNIGGSKRTRITTAGVINIVPTTFRRLYGYRLKKTSGGG